MSTTVSTPQAFVVGYWQADSAGVWHHAYLGWIECFRVRSRPPLFNGADGWERLQSPPEGAWICSECRAEVTKRIVEAE